MKYFGNFTDRDSVATDFRVKSDGYSGVIPADFPTDDEILAASYETPDWEGYAHVVFERDGKLYEVHGSHCSCMGLEDQWLPEETSWEAIGMSRAVQDAGTPFHQRLNQLVAERGYKGEQ